MTADRAMTLSGSSSSTTNAHFLCLDVAALIHQRLEAVHQLLLAVDASLELFVEQLPLADRRLLLIALAVEFLFDRCLEARLS